MIPLLRKTAGAVALAFAMAGLAATQAAAVPAFAVQTGEPCQACHVGGFGPQLTPFGREFKLQGYTMRTKNGTLPFSAMAVASYLRTAEAQNPAPDPHYNANDNIALDQVSLFFAGGFGEHFGAFIQTTYDGVARAWGWDNLDLRATTTTTIKGKDVVLGASLNNSPTVDDAWNSLSAWGYPYTDSALAPSPSASPLLLGGGLAQTSLGLTGYAWINSTIYVEGGGYWSPDAHTLSRLGADPTDPGDIDGLAPYGRVAFQHDAGPGVLEVGLSGMKADIHPGLDRAAGVTDHYSDLGVDGSWIQTLASGDTLSFNGRYLHERQRLEATCALAEAEPGCASNNLDDLRFDAAYYWQNNVGLTAAVFETTGDTNPDIFGDNRTFKPDSSGLTLQLDATPFAAGSPFGPRFNMRVGAQYTAYGRFEGASHNYDGSGRNASDNDTLRIFVWAAY
jgi:hypothetical protein